METGHYFKGIKMLLYENKSTIVAQNSGKELSNLYNLLKKKWNKNYIYTYEVNGKDDSGDDNNEEEGDGEDNIQETLN